MLLCRTRVTVVETDLVTSSWSQRNEDGKFTVPFEKFGFSTEGTEFGRSPKGGV